MRGKKYRIVRSRSVPLLMAFCGLSGPTAAEMTHRWSFNEPAGAAPAGTVLVDRITGAVAHVQGNGAISTGSALTLPGTSLSSQAGAALSAYVDLPNGIISSRDALTVEVWATVHSLQNWQTLFDFGRTAFEGDVARQGAGAEPGEILPSATSTASGMIGRDFLSLHLNRSTLTRTQAMWGQIAGGTIFNVNSSRNINLGTRYQFVMTFQPGTGVFANTGGKATWYQNGIAAASVDLPFSLNGMEDVNNWLGRSQRGSFACSHITLEEFRLYDHAMTDEEINQSRTAGFNVSFPPPMANPDALTLHRGGMARIKVLDNDQGPLTPSLLSIVQEPERGTVEIVAPGVVLYRHDSDSYESDQFTYRVAGPGGFSQTAQVTLNFTSELRVPDATFGMPPEPPPIDLRLVNAFPGIGFLQPICSASPPGDSKRLFVGTRRHGIHVIPDVGAKPASSGIVLEFTSGGLFENRVPAEALAIHAEDGLLGLAFHPRFSENGFGYISYTVMIEGIVFHRISRITFPNPADPIPSADPATELILIEQRDDSRSHNGGDLHFGPDGYLYITMGDEGDQDDVHENGQRIDRDLFSGILRIDVDKKAGNLEPNPHPNPAEYPNDSHPPAIPLDNGVARFSIPIDNPFVPVSEGGDWDGMFNGVPIAPGHVRSEFWAVGLRHAWRMSFDPETGELWTGDVGGSLREEVNLIERGGNYGWAFREGTLPGSRAAEEPPGFVGIPPLYEYGHGSGPMQGNSVTGGIVYRGARIPALNGAYVFCDYVSGSLWSLAVEDEGPPTVTRIGGQAGVAAFGRDPSSGDVLLLHYSGGGILRLAASSASHDFPATLSETGLFAELATLTPSPGLLPYEVNLPFWSDHALKRRWFAIPGSTAKMTSALDAPWQFPDGQIWVKHFDLETERGNPATARRIETRVLVKNPEGIYGVSYRWDDAGGEAFLVDSGGESLTVPIMVAGETYDQSWRIPAMSDCRACHTPQAGHALSFETRQLNLHNEIHGFSGNQLTLLGDGGYLELLPVSPRSLPRHYRPDETGIDSEARVRSYLSVNCGYCHRPGGTAAPAEWDGRVHPPLSATGLVDGAATSGIDPLHRLVVPGHPDFSVALLRLADAPGYGRMPPLGSQEPDPNGIALLTEWINSPMPGRQGYDAWRIATFGSLEAPEGAPDENPDKDGFTNFQEFLMGTPPLGGEGFVMSMVFQDGPTMKVTFDLPIGSRGIVEVSDDLIEWRVWDVPGNTGLPKVDGTWQVDGPADEEIRFFRVRISER